VCIAFDPGAVSASATGATIFFVRRRDAVGFTLVDSAVEVLALDCPSVGGSSAFAASTFVVPGRGCVSLVLETFSNKRGPPSPVDTSRTGLDGTGLDGTERGGIMSEL